MAKFVYANTEYEVVSEAEPIGVHRDSYGLVGYWYEAKVKSNGSPIKGAYWLAEEPPNFNGERCESPRIVLGL